MGKRATTMSKKTKRKAKSATSANKRSQQETTALADVLECIRGNGCLHWSEILPLSGVNKTYLYHREVKSSPMTKIALKRLLLEFDCMVTTHEHYDCGKVYAPLSRRQYQCGDRTNHGPDQIPYANVDPRYSEEYDDWSLESDEVL
jgi:hypothetical protein